MATRSEFDDQPYQNINVQEELSTQLKKLRKQYPERFSRPTYALATVDDSTNGQWEQRLLQTKEDPSGERIVLIPYLFGNSQWIGILIMFRADGQVERAEFIDPMERSRFIPDKLQKEFQKVYPKSILQSKTLQKTYDQEECASLTVQNLIEAAKEAQTTVINYTEMGHSFDQTIDDQNTTRMASSASQGNVSKLEQPEFRLRSELARLKISDVSKLPEKIQRAQQRIQDYKDEERMDEVERETEVLCKLKELQTLAEQVSILKNKSPSISQSNRSQLDVLEKRLQGNLMSLRMQDISKLSEKIQKTQQRIKDYQEDDREDDAEKETKVLLELQELQKLAEEISILKRKFSFVPQSNQSQGDILEKKLQSELTRLKIQDLSKLPEKIQKTEQRIKDYQEDDREDDAEREKKILMELLEVKALASKVSGPKLSSVVAQKQQSQFIEERISSEKISTREFHSDNTFKEIETEEIVKIDSEQEEECLVTQENIRNMQEDFSSMPSCSERSIISLLYYVAIKLLGDTITLDHSSRKPDQIESEINKEFECLEKRLKIEEEQSVEIQKSIQTSFIHAKNRNWKLVRIELRKLLKQIRPLDIPELFRLVDGVDDAAHIIREQDIILFLGGTGSGKSTTIHFLAGSKMMRKNVKGINHIDPVGIRNPDLIKITTSPFARSETKYMTPVTVYFDDVGGCERGSIILCDSPGFEDTSGPEVDIANGIGIVKAIKGCKSVKPVMIFSYKSMGDKFQGLKNLTHVLVGLIPGIQDQIKAFSYLFTKYPESEKHTIHASLENIRKTMNEVEKSDISFMNFFKDMLNKTKKGGRVIDPIKDHPGEILDELAQTSAISHPDEVFHFSITEKSKATVQEQVRKHQLSIISATKNSEFLLVKYKLDQLKRLSDLLGQKNVEQIYNECVRFVNKHLSQEYDEGISALNRCLQNQITVSIEDIEQYKIRIEHAKLAESLKTDHLGKDAIHTSAFLQHLSQQVTTMVADLQEKDIHDMSVKIALDKIKLLVSSFPHIDCSYNNIRQRLILKFENVVSSFKSLVQLNEFEKIASELTKLHQALTILQDHLDFKSMEIKYMQSKEYFLKYLNDSVRKLGPILTQEKFEKSDVDALNSCVNLLESAMNTYALHSHISKDDMNSIYEEFLSKIQHHFAEIIAKIDTQFENKNENFFQSLEYLVKEMSLIRAIPSIQYKTNPSYYSTLEKLSSYVKESRDYVEEKLKKIRQKEEEVDYSKLAQYLSSLKYAKWIEEYRAGVYTDVMGKIEEQIIRHVERLKKSIMETNLDLDNFDKIERVNEMTTEINGIICVKRFIPDVEQYIKEVNRWFEEITDQMLVMIKDIYSSEHQEKFGYQTLNFNKIVKAFKYLDACKRVPALYKRDCASVLDNLEKFIRDFSNFIQKEMEECFETIKQYHNNDKKDMLAKVRTLSSYMREISEIKKNQPLIFSYFSQQKIIEHWQNELATYVTELSDEMEQLKTAKHNDAISAKLCVMRALSRLDDFLLDQKYIDLYRRYQALVSLQAVDNAKSVTDAIQKGDYERVASELAALESSKEVGEQLFQTAKRALKSNLDNLMDETRDKAMLGENIEINDIRSIVMNMRQIQKSKSILSSYLGTAGEVEIDECIEEVKKSIGDRIKQFLDNVKGLIYVYNFSDADKKIELINTVRAVLGNYCTDDVSKQIESLKQVQQQVVEGISEKYSRMDITEYASNSPLLIFEKLERVSGTNLIYNAAIDATKKAIIAKFKEEFQRAKISMLSDLESIHVERIRSALKHLPEGIKNVLDESLIHCKNESAQLILDNNKKLDDAFNSGDVKNIKTVLEEYQNSAGMQTYVNKGRELALKQMNEIALQINENLDQYNIKEALANVKRLGSYKIELNNFVKENNQLYLDVESRLKAVFQKTCSTIISQFFHTNISVIPSETVQTIEKSFVCLLEFMVFKDEIKHQSLLIEILPKDFDENITKLNKQFSDFINELQKNYEIALEKLNITSLKNILSTICKYDTIFTKIKEYKVGHSDSHTSVNTMIQVLAGLTSYSQMLHSISEKIQQLADELMNQDLINSTTKEFNQQRNKFYKELNEKFSVLQQAVSLSSFNNMIDVNKIEEDCIKSYESKLAELFIVTEKFLKKFSEDFRLTTPDYDKFNLYYNNLLSFSQESKVTHLKIDEKLEPIDNIILRKVKRWADLAENSSKTEEIATNLLNMKYLADHIPSLKFTINERIDRVLNYHKSTSKFTTAFAKLAALLNQDTTGIGQSIISEHKAFQGYLLSLFNEKTATHDIKFVLNHLTGDSVDKDRLKKRYDEYYTIYQNLVKRYLKPDIDLEELISDSKLILGNIKQEPTRIEWDADIKTKIPRLMAHVFALWTLKNANHYFEATDIADRQNYLLQPHAAQVVSIFRICGIADKKEELINNLVQIKTGEGKSVTLAVTAAVFALLGFDVWCTCYSQQLSDRDYTAFLSLFDSLGLLDYIHYSTFNTLCENIINENGETRLVVEELISTGSNAVLQNSQLIRRARILLIDEVDVFFSREFYGNLYTPAASLQDPTITSLINYIWTNRKSKLNLNKIKATNEYQACCDKFSNWDSLIEEAVKDLLYDVTNFQSHDYVVHQDKIGYTEQDGITFNVNYGYKTLFAYYYEHETGEHGTISRESLEKNISIRIKCGSFSYAEIPLEFKYIIGVTGTLESLSDLEKEIVQKDYKIKKSTLIPSVFGKNNLKFTEKDDVKIENSDDYFNKIREEIDKRLAGRTGKRAVLVFFESKQKLMNFYTSKALEPIKGSVTYLTEEASLEEKEYYIKRATISDQITLLTRTYGRGIDFVCYDQTVTNNDGVHVIQTFLSEEVSEELQIKGRTARQGNCGSYSMILLEQDLEKFHIVKEDIDTVREGKRIRIRSNGPSSFTYKTVIFKTVHDYIQQKRADLFEIQYKANKKYVEVAKEKHKIAQQFLSNLKAGDLTSIKRFLVEENKGVEGIWKSRTVCLMDATSSMSNLLLKCKNTVQIMFERASEILRQNNINSDTFQIQFAVYRNYNSRQNKILQSSSWETRPDNLRSFMNTINVDGGWSNEAIEIGLWHANKENERDGITQVILIGDAPPNSKDDVALKRAHFGESYWARTKFVQPKYYRDELATLISNSIPVHAFYVEMRAEESFTQIANLSGGQCAMLDIDSSLGADILTDLVTKEVLRNVGGEVGGQALVNQYERTYARN